MAAPADMKTTNLSGKFYMNKTLSDPTDDILTLQGLSWFTRKAIGLATITLYVKHYTSTDSIEHIDIDQTLTGGIKGTTESRVLDWAAREHSDHIFGRVNGRSRRIQLSEIDDEFLKTGWMSDMAEQGLVESDVTSEDNDWAARQIWGFEEIDGEKKYVRHLVLKTMKRGDELKKKLVYDYIGPLDE
ncbi:hypothetical protein EDC01DRAFT_650024 [Geopyxis carbonaria]|nr:hypothetical protein EDC01DRAFT_650024 [Geopyxis carbonaria]